VNPETATSLGPAISYAAAHHVQLISVDTIVGVGKVYMVVRASNTIYGLDACALISSKVKSGYVLDLEGDLISSNGADRTNAFNSCMAANAPGVHILKDPTVWTEATAVTDAQNAVNAYGSQLKAIYAQWSSPDTGVLPLLKSKHLTGKVMVVSDDGVPFEMCDVGNGTLDASQSQPVNLYAYWALKYALDAANGVTHSAGQPGGGAPALQMVSYAGDTGRAIYAIGGNRQAARAAGIKVDRVRIGVYVAGSVLAAVGGLMEAGRVSSVASTQGYGEGIIFAVFAAAVIGGVSLQGGRGNMVGAASGVALLGVVQNILDLENAPNYWIDAIDGGVILVALILARVIGGEASAE
jgi:hypothetical protein